MQDAKEGVTSFLEKEKLTFQMELKTYQITILGGMKKSIHNLFWRFNFI